MKKRECAIVQDLLVLYEDDVLQEESMQMVEEHIRGCEECMRIYENMEKKLTVTDGEAGRLEKRQEEQDSEAKKVMRRLGRNITYKHILITSVILAVVLVGTTIAERLFSGNFGYSDDNWGIAGMIYTIPAEEIEIAELYQLKNGDIYCTLRTDRQIGIRQVSDWNLPGNDVTASTDEAEHRVRFRRRTPWERDGVECNQVSFLYATEREGELMGSGEKVIQRCQEISYIGKSEEDKLTIWQRGQTVKEAPEAIERQAILEYVRDDQVEKAVQECENMGWDSDEEIARAYAQDRDISYIYGDYASEEVVFGNGFQTIMVD